MYYEVAAGKCPLVAIAQAVESHLCASGDALCLALVEPITLWSLTILVIYLVALTLAKLLI